MPIKSYNVGRQRSTRNAIAINALLTWRGKMLRSLRLAEGATASVAADIDAIDRVLVNVLGFTGDVAEASKDFRREAIFKRGELRRAVMNVMREANGPLTTRQVTERVMATKDRQLSPGRQSKEWINRVRKACQALPLDTVSVDGCAGWVRRA